MSSTAVEGATPSGVVDEPIASRYVACVVVWRERRGGERGGGAVGHWCVTLPWMSKQSTICTIFESSRMVPEGIARGSPGGGAEAAYTQPPRHV